VQTDITSPTTVGFACFVVYDCNGSVFLSISIRSIRPVIWTSSEKTPSARKFFRLCHRSKYLAALIQVFRDGYMAAFDLDLGSLPGESFGSQTQAKLFRVLRRCRAQNRARSPGADTIPVSRVRPCRIGHPDSERSGTSGYYQKRIAAGRHIPDR